MNESATLFVSVDGYWYSCFFLSLYGDLFEGGIR